MKLGYNIIENMKILNLSADEIDFLIYIGQFQIEDPSVAGISYKVAIKELEIARSNYYRITRTLVAKGVIYARTEYDNWIFEIINNTVISKNEGQYINLNIELLHSKEFKKIKSNEKLIIFNLIQLSGFKNNKIEITFKKLMDWTGAKAQSIKHYLKTLKRLFQDNIEILGKKIIISNENNKLFKRRSVREDVVQQSQNIIYLSKKEKINLDLESKELEDTAKLYKQYKNIIPETVDDKQAFINDKVTACLQEKASLIPTYINTSIKNAINEIKKRLIKEEKQVPSSYNNSFIPYDKCYEKESLTGIVEGLLENIIFDNRGHNEILNITKNNIINMLTETDKPSKIKGAVITHRKFFELMRDVSSNSAEGFCHAVVDFVNEASEKFSNAKVKGNVNRYLNSWLYDFWDKNKLTKYIVN